MNMGGGEEGGFLWENESWAFSNSDDNSCGSGENPQAGGTKKQKKKKKDDDDDEIEEEEAGAGAGAEEEENRISNSPKPPARDTAGPPSSANGAASGKRSNTTNTNNNNKRKGIMSGQGNLYNNEQGKAGTTTAESDHEMHIWTERERRKKMRSMFSSLHALLPQLPPKADKSTIVDEAVNYIKTLEQTVQKLEKQKVERLHGVGTVTTSICSYDHSQIKAVGLMESSREAFLADQGSTSTLLLHHHQSTNSFSNFSRHPPPSPTAGAAVFRTWVSPNVILNICGDNAHINVCCPKRLGIFTAITFFLEKNKLEVVSAQVSSDHYRTMFMIQAQVINGAIDHFPQSFSSVEEIFQQAAGEIMSYISSL